VPPIPLKFIGRIVMPDRRVIASLSDGRANVLRHGRADHRRAVSRGEDRRRIDRHGAVNGTGRQTLQLRGS
jgi:hypothetical protein